MKIDLMKFELLQAGMTREEVAEKVGIGVTTIYNINKTGRCSRITFHRILKAFQIEPEDLLAEEDDND